MLIPSGPEVKMIHIRDGLYFQKWKTFFFFLLYDGPESVFSYSWTGVKRSLLILPHQKVWIVTAVWETVAFFHDFMFKSPTKKCMQSSFQISC